MSLFGFELILNQVDDRTRSRAGQGRLFIGLEDDQREPVRKHLADKGIQTFRVEWGRPTLAIRDLDANELFFWLPHDDFSGFGNPGIASAEIAGSTKWNADNAPFSPRARIDHLFTLDHDPLLTSLSSPRSGLCPRRPSLNQELSSVHRDSLLARDDAGPGGA